MNSPNLFNCPRLFEEIYSGHKLGLKTISYFRFIPIDLDTDELLCSFVFCSTIIGILPSSPSFVMA